MTEPLPDDKLAEIRAGLGGVTPGPWFEGDKWVFVDPLPATPHKALRHIMRDVEEIDANCAHIARLDPQTILSLLARLDKAEAERDEHNARRRMAEAKLMALEAGAVLGGKALVPVEPTDEMLAATCDKDGRMRLLEFTVPEERGKAFLMPRYIYRAMIASLRPTPPKEDSSNG